MEMRGEGSMEMVMRRWISPRQSVLSFSLARKAGIDETRQRLHSSRPQT